jgi:hypothetical protein
VKAFNPYRFPEDSSPFANLMKQMSSLTHPCIVKIQNFTIPRNGVGPVVVSDYVDNGSMEDIIQKLRLDRTCVTHADDDYDSRYHPWNELSSQLWHRPRIAEAIRPARRSRPQGQDQRFCDDENGGIESDKGITSWIAVLHGT